MKPTFAFRLTAFALLFLSTSALKPSIASTKTETFTTRISEPGVVVHANNPCLGHITAILSYDGVIHVTANANGFHTVTAIHGSATTLPSPGVEGFTGSFNEVETLNINRNTTETSFVVTQRGTHGVSFHITFHVTVDSEGAAKADVFNFTCG